MKVHVLGAGTPDPRKERYGSAFLLELGNPEQQILIDCGPGTTYKMACMGIRPTQVSHFFLTHHHFDHNADVPCFALTRWDQSGPDAMLVPLPVFGPQPTAKFFDQLFGEPNGAYYPDWKARLETPASKYLHVKRGGTLPRTPPMFDIHQIASGATYETDNWKMTAAWVHHVEPWLENLAYKFETDEGTIVFTGDAGACPELTAFCQGADTIVLCCAYGLKENMDECVAHAVTGAEDCAELVAATQPSTVILDHCSSGVSAPGSRERMAGLICNASNARIIVGDELTTITI